VFRHANPAEVEELAPRADADFLQTVAGNEIGFSRAIDVASPAFIRLHHERYGGRVPPVTHAGINDIFVEKASIVWYWHQGTWLQHTGSN